MTEWILSAVTLVVLAVLMPWLISLSRRSARGRRGSAAIGGAIEGFFDPAKKVAIERIELQREIGDHEDGQSGDRPDRAQPSTFPNSISTAHSSSRTGVTDSRD